MFLKTIFLLLAGLGVALTHTPSSACNNSPDLCDRSYNNITHLGAHDSPFLRDSSTDFSISGNQYYNTTVQLSAGVRLLTAQVQRTTNSESEELHVCHSSCELMDAGKLSDWLGEVGTWLKLNADEIVTLLLVNGANANASELAAEYEAAGVADHGYQHSSVSTNSTSGWPTLQTLINNGTRLLSFVASLDDNTDAPYLMDEFTYIFENDYESYRPSDYSCMPNRPSSVANDTSSALSAGMMPLMNHFLYTQMAFGIETPNDTYIHTTNGDGGAGSLGSVANTCTGEYGGQAPTFVLVDFFSVGPAVETVDRLNGVTGAVGRTNVSTEVLSETSGAAAAAVAITGGRMAMLCLTLSASLVLGP